MSTAMYRAGRPALFTVEQAAWIAGVSTDRIYRAIRTGTLPTVRGRVLSTALTLVLAEVAVTAWPNGHPIRGGDAP